MAKSFIAYINPEWSLQNRNVRKSLIPIGVLVTTGTGSYESRIVGRGQLTKMFPSLESLSEDDFSRIEAIFSITSKESVYPSRLMFRQIEENIPGDLNERAESLFRKYVAPHYKES